jgi:hypothetical protein
MTLMWPTISFTDDQNKPGNLQNEPNPNQTTPEVPVPSIKETANAISDNLMIHVDRALESAVHSIQTTLPPSHYRESLRQ